LGSCTAAWPAGWPTRSSLPGRPPSRPPDHSQRGGARGVQPRRYWPLDRPDTRDARGTGTPQVKRDRMAGLVGCWIRLPPKAAPHSQRVWLHALITLDHGHGRGACFGSRGPGAGSRGCAWPAAGVTAVVERS
jgi:hypothetical protein